MKNTIESLVYLTEGFAVTETPIIRNKGMILFDTGHFSGTYPMVRSNDEYMRKMVEEQIEKRNAEPYGFEYDFYLLYAYQNHRRTLKDVSISLWSTIHWIKQRPFAPIPQTWIDTSACQGFNQNEYARVCLVGSWWELNSYPTILYDKIKDIADFLGFKPTASKVKTEADFYKPPFGRAINHSQLFETRTADIECDL